MTGIRSACFDSAKRIHYRLFDDSVAILDLSGGVLDGFRVDGLSKLGKEYLPVVVKGQLWMVHINGGIVHRIDRKGLHRLDRSFEHRMQAGSLIFVHQDTLFRHGGYGFWSTREHLTYFNEASYEWELRKLSIRSEPPPGLFAHRAIWDGRQYIVFFGIRIDPVEALTLKPNLHVWSFNPETREWHRMGTVNARLPEEFNAEDSFALGDRMIVFAPEMKARIFDAKELTIHSFELSPAFLSMVRNAWIRPFFHDGQFYFYRTVTPHSNEFRLDAAELEFCRIPLDKLFIREIGTAPMIKSFWHEFRNGAWLLSGGVLVIGMFFLIRNRNRKPKTGRMTMEGDTIRVGRQRTSLSTQEAAIIRLLLTATEDVTTNSILEITGNPNQDPTHNLRVKNQIIDHLNYEMSRLLGTQENMIYSEKSPADRRIKRYLIRKEYFQA